MRLWQISCHASDLRCVLAAGLRLAAMTDLTLSTAAGFGRDGFIICRVDCFQFSDQSFDHGKATLPEGRIASVETEGLEQLGVMLRPAGCEHVEIALGKPRGGLLVDRVK